MKIAVNLENFTKDVNPGSEAEPSNPIDRSDIPKLNFE